MRKLSLKRISTIKLPNINPSGFLEEKKVAINYLGVEPITPNPNDNLRAGSMKKYTL